MDALAEVLDDLVHANRILAHEGVVDGYGHISVRHPDRNDRFFMSCSRSPELVRGDDIMEFDLESRPVDQRGRDLYLERPIHGAVYQARADVMAVVHNHANELLPFGVTKTPLRPVLHAACGMGAEVPLWDIREGFGETDMLVTTMEQGHSLAGALADKRVALMRGHGSVVVGASLREAVWTSVYLTVNARLQFDALRLGPVTYLTNGEIDRTFKRLSADVPLERIWQYWIQRYRNAALRNEGKRQSHDA